MVRRAGFLPSKDVYYTPGFISLSAILCRHTLANLIYVEKPMHRRSARLPAGLREEGGTTIVRSLSRPSGDPSLADPRNIDLFRQDGLVARDIKECDCLALAGTGAELGLLLRENNH